MPSQLLMMVQEEAGEEAEELHPSVPQAPQSVQLQAVEAGLLEL